MKFLFDTNTVSELMRGNDHVITKIRACNRQDVAIAQPVVAEIEFGLAMLPRGRRWRHRRLRLPRITGGICVSGPRRLRLGHERLS